MIKADSSISEALAYLVYDSSQEPSLIQIESLAKRCGLAIVSPTDIAEGKVSDKAAAIMFNDGLWRVHLDNGAAIVSVDFFEPRFYARLNNAGLHREYVVRAVLGRKKMTQPLTVLDATAGFGHDACLLAAAGCDVTMVEQIPLLACLLEQAVQQISDVSTNDLLLSAGERMKVVEADSLSLMQQWSDPRPDVIYLDPMYAHPEAESKRGLKKTAAVKKNMAFLQRLTDFSNGEKSTGISDGQGLIEAALSLATRKVVVKRAPGAEWLGGIKPASSLTGKATRFDVYPLA